MAPFSDEGGVLRPEPGRHYPRALLRELSRRQQLPASTNCTQPAAAAAASQRVGKSDNRRYTHRRVLALRTRKTHPNHKKMFIINGKTHAKPKTTEKKHCPYIRTFTQARTHHTVFAYTKIVTRYEVLFHVQSNTDGVLHIGTNLSKKKKKKLQSRFGGTRYLLLEWFAPRTGTVVCPQKANILTRECSAGHTGPRGCFGWAYRTNLPKCRAPGTSSSYRALTPVWLGL